MLINKHNYIRLFENFTLKRLKPSTKILLNSLATCGAGQVSCVVVFNQARGRAGEMMSLQLLL